MVSTGLVDFAQILTFHDGVARGRSWILVVVETLVVELAVGGSRIVHMYKLPASSTLERVA